MSEQTHAWCPACAEESAIDRNRRCLWCGGETRAKRGGGKRPGVWGKLSDEHLRALHVAHMQGTSMRELGRQVWERMGYSSPQTAAMGIGTGWKRLSLPARPRAEATAAANAERRTPGSPGTADRTAYKRWLREKAGGRRLCSGVRLAYPRKGEPCQRWAMRGSDFCLQHDPGHRAEVVERAQAMREATHKESTR